jgi:type III pantothenate kinase
MILAIDVGNTRVKWGLCEGADAGFGALGAVGLDELDRLAQAWADIPQPSRIAIASVAGAQTNARIADALARYAIAPNWLASQARAGGVTNGYENPSQLGVDRFAALVAAHARHAGECMIVMSGTATTIDVLAADGAFRGGVILPGLHLMKRALAEKTAGLSLAAGQFRLEPRNTADAIESGCLHAQAGAIERMRARLGDAAAVFVSGGAAAIIAPLLPFPVQRVEHLVLEGVVRLA